MKFNPIEVKDKLGRTIILRSAEVSDASDLLKYLKVINGETPYLIREPEEVTLTLEQEVKFIQGQIDSEKKLLLIATLDGAHIGNCSVGPAGSYKRYAHRGDMGIALYKKYCGAGIGELMMRVVLDVAKEIGYEQVELEVIADNVAARKLYMKLGFMEYGRFPNNMKYKDGNYADAIWMMKKI